MPKVKRSKKSPPEGWELIEPTLDELEAKLREGKCVLHAVSGLLSETDPFSVDTISKIPS